MIKYLHNAKVVDEKIVKKKKVDIQNIYSYLDNRNFDNYVKPIEINEQEEIYPFVQELETTDTDRGKDLLYLASILHNKTTEFREKNEDQIKEIYETTIQNLNETYHYYLKLQDEIEEHVYMSPAELLLMDNISKIYYMINSSRYHIERFYKTIEKKDKIRYSRIHGDLKLEHIIESKEKHLISWNQSRIDIPILDLVKFYKEEQGKIEFQSLYQIYQQKYENTKEEKDLFFSLINIPNKIELTNDNYQNIIHVRKLVDYINSTILFTSQENKEDQEASE